MARRLERAGARSISYVIAATLLMTGFASAVHAQGTGPEVGAQAPGFQATDHLGKAQSFDDLAGENGLLLLFFRSADW